MTETGQVVRDVIKNRKEESERNRATAFRKISVLKGTLRRDQKVIFVKSPISSPIVMFAP